MRRPPHHFGEHPVKMTRFYDHTTLRSMEKSVGNPRTPYRGNNAAL